MIEFLQGELLNKGINHIVLRVGGLGFRIQVSALTRDSLPPLQEEVTLFTHLHVREDEYSMFGFINLEERLLFNDLLSVSGIGPKLAMAVLSKYAVSELKRIIMVGDSAALMNITGVGKKTSERIILELKDKIGKQELQVSLDTPEQTGTANVRGQAVNALLALGYSLTEAQKAVPPINPADKSIRVEDLIRAALKTMAKY